MHKDTARHLRYASGYTELEMFDDAANEIEKIAYEDRFTPPVLAARLALYMGAKFWDVAAGVGRELAQRVPENADAWIQCAYALRELGRIEEAREVLLQAEPIHGRTHAIIHYNLACYFCLLGELETARKCLRRACKMEPKFKRDALDDRDLESLWGTRA